MNAPSTTSGTPYRLRLPKPLIRALQRLATNDRRKTAEYIRIVLTDHVANPLNRWQPIETAPKDGSLIVGFAPSWGRPSFLVWKTNPRIVSAHKSNESPEMAESYFGNPDESDDYELAQPGGGPTHWHPLAALPKS